jgi:membrane associated rhomboid family serine protease
MPPLPPITKFLMLVCTAVFCVQQIVPLDALFALWPLPSGRFMPWQVLSYAFLHGGVMHLFFNMFGLWMFGSELERLWGQRRYTHFLLASVLSAAVVQLLISYTQPLSPTIGASGALFGLLLAFGMLFPNRTILPLFPPIPMKAKTFVFLFGAVSFVSGLLDQRIGTVQIAHFAHLGGMLGGWLMIQYWRGKPPFSGRGPRRVR